MSSSPNPASPGQARYRGRFAPSPTGPLHFGSLVTALGSYLQARSQQGEWLVRMEDLDPPREQPGAADAILRALDAYHLHWDGSVRYQSTRSEAYEAALEQLAADRHTFPCTCSRKTAGHIYPGTCRNGLPPGAEPRAIRLRVTSGIDSFSDRLQGQINTELETEVGDFVVHRADGLYAYHLAVVVDDADQRITEIVRGTDLLSSTPPQRYLQDCLSHAHPQYCHLPIAVNQAGQKLSKQTFAAAIDIHNPGPTLEQALTFLGHSPDPELSGADPALLLSWAVEHWKLQNVPQVAAICHETAPV